jgi:hypothetical protein
MKETRTINLNGMVFHIDNDAYHALNDYLQDIELRLSSDERKDVMADLEARICELLQSELFARNVQVVDIQMTDNIRTRIGEPSEFGENKRPKEKKKAQSERSGCGRVLKITLQVILALIAIQILLPVLAVILSLSLGAIGLGIGALEFLPGIGMLFFGGSKWLALLTAVSATLAVLLPIVAIINSIVTYMRTRRGPKARFWITTGILWLLSVICFCVVIFKQGTEFSGVNNLVHNIRALDNDDDRMTARSVVSVPYFNAVEIGGAVSADIRRGGIQAIEADTNDVFVRVRDSVLVIDGRGNINRPLHVEMTVPELKSLSLSGASKADISGEFEEVHYAVSGASKLDAEDAPTDIVHVNCSGASKAEVHAVKELWAQASGASTVKYKGKPAMKKKMAVGASKIQRD